ncbi:MULTISPECIES: TetR/AcrR family transcriptional regulator [Rhodococcus]|uniref:TetR/AcrR family transcriptional regulator n=1 Tax=Rhodococcus TaxID=1827 RepID=UPI0005A78339|nr:MULTISPECIES: TetR/AcrR family transcriptional regulator [Rhodococcus]KLN69113.1 TetR family transcriptional regulator [Rhodococcus erythropolis]MBP2522532.1 AcrR family transcriptional regulator [Rhodococcus sp. PvP104]MCD2133975.1 TetR/AcrR family transcriptional regulator [Rhodococcus qingshengii]MCZ4544831.1 TetR/AcrR family transcriptional regulator [Rhodococcus qingshengii]MDA3631939.1 TetR/AcrR family transcriptional regulator [Rhodococcus sp. C-2]
MAERQRGGRAVKAEARREAILDATMAEIAERGYRGTTLAAVAERVGLTQPGLLHHFPSKEHLLIGVLEARDRWDAAALLATSTDVRLSHLEQIVEFNAERPGVVQTFTALAAESATGQHPAREFFTERYASVREGMAALLRAELGDRLAGGLTPEEAAPLLIAVIDGIQIQWLLAPDEVDMPAAFRNFLALLTAMTQAEAPPA